MINIVKEKQKLNNIDPLVVYFILNKDESTKHRDDIESLNNHSGFTRGVFKFKAISQADCSNLEFSDNSRIEFSDSNVIVQLVDDAEGYCLYAFSHIDFDEDNRIVENSIVNITTALCKENIAILQHRYDSIKSSDNLDTHICDGLSKAIDIFTKAAKKPRPRKAVWGSSGRTYCLNESILSCNINSFLECDINDLGRADSIHSVKEFIAKREMSPKARRTYDFMKSEFDENDMRDILIELLGSFSNVPTIKDAKIIGEIGVSEKYAGDTRQDHYCQYGTEQKDSFEIRVKRVSTRIYGKDSLKYGVEIVVNDEPTSIYFGSKDQTMVYITALLCHKIDDPLYLYELYANLHCTKPQRIIGKRKGWLNSIYNTIFDYPSKTFPQWFEGVKERNGSPLYQAKTQINNTLKKAFIESSEVINRYKLNTIQDLEGDFRYAFNCDSEEISMDNELQQLCDKYSRK